jgi:hypothetical protein
MFDEIQIDNAFAWVNKNDKKFLAGRPPYAHFCFEFDKGSVFSLRNNNILEGEEKYC